MGPGGGRGRVRELGTRNDLVSGWRAPGQITLFLFWQTSDWPARYTQIHLDQYHLPPDRPQQPRELLPLTGRISLKCWPFHSLSTSIYTARPLHTWNFYVPSRPQSRLFRPFSTMPQAFTFGYKLSEYPGNMHTRNWHYSKFPWTSRKLNHSRRKIEQLLILLLNLSRCATYMSDFIIISVISFGMLSYYESIPKPGAEKINHKIQTK